MARISAALRKETQTLPGGRFPMPDAEHARLALEFLSRSNTTPAEKAKVKARANRMLGK
jgi:hypothetical protein